MTTVARFRQLALALPDAVEGSHHGHADFRAGGRVFASLHPDGQRGMVKVPVAEQAELCARFAGDAEPAAGAWGRAGCTYLRLAGVPVAAVKAALTSAWQAAVAERPPRRRR